MFTVILYIVQKAIFPFLFALCVICRPAILSVPYLILLFYAPFLPVPQKSTFHKHTRRFFKLIIIITTALIFLQICLQITLVVRNESLTSIGRTGKILLNIGMTELYKSDTKSFCWCFLLDVILCFASFLTLFVFNSRPSHFNDDIEDPAVIGSIYINQQHLKSNAQYLNLLKIFVINIVLSTLLIAGISQPSIPGAIYFVMFLFIITMWAISKTAIKTFKCCLWFLSTAMIAHISSLFTYQTTWLTAQVKQNSTMLKYFGLKSLIPLSDGSGHNELIPTLADAQADALLHPEIILLCYYSSVMFLRDVSKIKAGNINPLRPINMEASTTQIDSANTLKTFCFQFYGFICRHSYIVSNIMMMIWSIVFYSWYAFVFLVVVRWLWIRPIQQLSIRRLNLFIVFYADFLLILEYVCCMIHTASDQPLNEKLVEWSFIIKSDTPFASLLFKTICTFTFCFTLKQQRKRDEIRKKEPNQRSNSFQFNSIEGQTIRNCVDFGINVLTHIWVAMIIMTMFIYAIYGSEVNLMKFCYLVYVFVFIISYQLSLRVWHKIMFALWMLVVFSTKINLILVYTFQHDDAHKVWSYYMGADPWIQSIIGLNHYETTELLTHLFYFTFLLVITYVQLFVFHKMYVRQFIWKVNPNHANLIKQNTNAEPNRPENIGDKTYIQKIIQRFISFIELNQNRIDWVCSFLEMQLFKVVLIVGFLMSISEISGFNMLLTMLIVFACCFEEGATNMSTGIITLITAIVVISKMFYQMLQIPDAFLDLFCIPDVIPNAISSTILICNFNATAHWIGVYKSDKEENLVQFLGHYLIFIKVATVYCTVKYYQKRKRFMKGEASTRPDVLFDGVTREDADKNVVQLVKYLFNYGFYKFGIEVTLVAMAILISIRKDTLSIVYIFWLCIIVGVERRTNRFIWPMFQYFVVISIVSQYAVMLNLPPTLKSSYPWVFEAIQQTENLIITKNQSGKLFYDFLVLMCACRQRNVFQIEKRNGGRKYPGGRNESSVRDIAIVISGQLPIRTHDFLYPTNWLDILKCIVYFSSFWVTLSIVLLTGTNDVSAFSLGYLISSFLLCYIGTNFYQKPIYSILRWWNCLITYNLFVILAKSAMNMRLIIGDFYSTQQLLSAIHTFLSEDKNSTKPLDMTYDCFCFVFLIFQLRIFKSMDFCHIINESKATFVCDSRGTKLLAERMREMHALQVQREKETLENIQDRFVRIKANQRRFEPNLIAAKTHSEAVRYNGRHLSEELIVETGIDLRHRERVVEVTESLSPGDPSRIEEIMPNQREWPAPINETGTENHENQTHKSYLTSVLRNMMVSITLYLYKFSRNYRFVHEILSKEKKLLKLKKCGQNTDDEQMSFFSYKHSVLSEFVQALWFALIANTDVICYLFIFLNTIASMSIWMLPMSLCVCLWAMLTIPRPSKRFWLTIIAYTEVMVFVQYFLQIISYFYTIEIVRSNVTYNLILLHLVLFHRSVLKHMGIWTYTKKNNKDAVHVLEFLKFRSLKSTIKLDSIVQIPADVYTFMFLCELFNFFLLMLEFSAFSRSVKTYLNEGHYPYRFLFALLVQFISLIIDRALYLRRNMKAKIVFHVLSVIIVHIWQFRFIRMFYLQPTHTVTWPPMLFYFVKCIYFLFSAYQIRCGYPKCVSGNFANGQSHSIMKGYKKMPFLKETRTLLDWICTKTSLGLSEWFKMEEIYTHLFSIKCHREHEKAMPRPRGRTRASKGDYFRAFMSLVIFFMLIWVPWTMTPFDLFIGKPNIPYEVRVALHIGPTAPIYQMTAHPTNIHQFTHFDLVALNEMYANNTAMRSILAKYDAEDIAAVTLRVNSSSVWMLSPPSFRNLFDELRRNVPLKIGYAISISRKTYQASSNTVQINREFHLTENVTVREQLIQLFDRDVESIHLPNLFPKFLKVSDWNHIEHLQAIPEIQEQGLEPDYRQLRLKIREFEHMIWSELMENCNETFYQEILPSLPYEDCDQHLVLFTFNQKLHTSFLHPIIGKGILGLYATYVLLTSHFFRQFLAKNVSDIMYDDLPYVDRLLQLCSDIYLAREHGDFRLEEYLFAKLIFVYRSPETLIRWTQLPDVEPVIEYVSDIDESDAEKALRKSLSH